MRHLAIVSAVSHYRTIVLKRNARIVFAAFRGHALTLGSERINRMGLKQQLGVLTVEFAHVAPSAVDLARRNRQESTPS
jgi:hypothetical protein